MPIRETYEVAQTGSSYPSYRKYFPPVTTAILVIQVGLYIVGSFSEALRTTFHDWLALDPAAAFGHGRIWQLATYPLYVGQVGDWIMNAFVLIFFGSRLERAWGRGVYLVFLPLMAAAATLPFLLLGSALSGGAGLSLAIIAAVGWTFRRQIISLFGYQMRMLRFVQIVLAIVVLLSLRPLTNLIIFFAVLWGFLFAWVMAQYQDAKAWQPRRGGPRGKPGDKGKKGGRFSGLDLGD